MKYDLGLLPNFLIIGAAKAGTTTLYSSLRRHPEVYFPFKKEMHFFNNDIFYGRGVDWYIRTFFKNARRYTVRGDATPAYLYWGEKVIPRITETYGSQPPRMIAILRDPVERAYSLYWHNRRTTKEPLSFEAALAAEDDRLARNRDDLRARGKATWAYFRAGLYSEQLERYFDRFPRESFHIMLLDDMKRDFAATTRDLFTFLRVDPDFSIAPSVSNSARTLRNTPIQRFLRATPSIGESLRKVLPVKWLHYFRSAMRHVLYEEFSYAPMDPKTERMLRERYLPDMQHLEKLLGRDLSKWRSAPSQS